MASRSPRPPRLPLSAYAIPADKVAEIMQIFHDTVVALGHTPSDDLARAVAAKHHTPQLLLYVLDVTGTPDPVDMLCLTTGTGTHVSLLLGQHHAASLKPSTAKMVEQMKQVAGLHRFNGPPLDPRYSWCEYLRAVSRGVYDRAPEIEDPKVIWYFHHIVLHDLTTQIRGHEGRGATEALKQCCCGEVVS